MRTFRWLYALFFLSGFPALLYQIVWQRALFAVYGVNIESVTMVVSAFMLGLGLGSLAGGRLSLRKGVPLLLVFGALELGIAAFGLISLRLFHWVAEFTAGAGALATGLISFALVLVPTLLMGATLPLLVAHLVRLSGNVGRAVGMLYFVNTLGSAVACFVAATVTMPKWGMSGSVLVAAAINVAVGGTVLALHFMGARTAELDASPLARKEASFPFWAGLLLAAVAGFLSLGYEILWYRVYSFLSEGAARGFAFLLGAYLAGIAFGSLASRILCRGILSRKTVGVAILAGNLVAFAAIPLIGEAVRSFGYEWTLPVIAISAGLLGAAFPLICHLAIPPDSDAGEGLSYLYLANIVGSTLGSFVVGFVLLDLTSLSHVASMLSLLGVICASYLLPRPFAIVALIIPLTYGAPSFYNQIYEKLQYKSEWTPDKRYVDLVETRSGVVSTDAEGTVYGGGHYDGMLVTDLTVNDAPLRPYAVSFFHPNPRRVLMVGMAGGAWVQVMANHPQVEHITAVEINPGYFPVLKRHEEVRPLLSNPKVKIEIDDGRRWLVRHPQEKFDLILMDTTSYWRAHAANLLSREFLQLVRRHLAPNGILYYNTTHSADAQRTGLDVFPYGYRFGRFLAVSDAPVPIDRERWRNTLLAYKIEGTPVFDLDDPDDRARLDEVLGYADTLHNPQYNEFGMEDAASIRRRVAHAREITDDNMACEWGPRPLR